MTTTTSCPTCNHHRTLIANARGDLGDTRAKLIRAQQDPAERRIAELTARAHDIKARLDEAQANLDDHLYECDQPTTPARPTTNQSLTDKQKHQIRERRRHGETLRAIAADYDVSRTTIQNICADMGITRLAPFEDQPWAVDGLCAQTDPEAFFPEKGGSTREAKAVCNGRPADDRGTARPGCPVRDECLRYALDNDERFGIWGGLSERERRSLKRQQLEAS